VYFSGVNPGWVGFPDSEPSGFVEWILVLPLPNQQHQIAEGTLNIASIVLNENVAVCF